MSFRDMVQADLHNVFFNVEEFAEEHTINGKKMLCVIDQDENAASSVQSVMGVYVANRRIYVKESDMKVLPKEGLQLRLDDRMYFVTDARLEMGAVVIELQVNRA